MGPKWVTYLSPTWAKYISETQVGNSHWIIMEPHGANFSLTHMQMLAGKSHFQKTLMLIFKSKTALSLNLTFILYHLLLVTFT